MISVSVDPPEVEAAFRAGIGGRWTFLSDESRELQAQLGLREITDTVHYPYVPTVFTLDPDLRIHSAYNGYWLRGFVGWMPSPIGPGVQRYAGAPWPWDHF
jgi:peroxiredoxin